MQLLRGDDGAIQQFFLTSADHSDVFAHQLMWALASEARPPEEAFNPEVKRCVISGCSPVDTYKVISGCSNEAVGLKTLDGLSGCCAIPVVCMVL